MFVGGLSPRSQGKTNKDGIGRKTAPQKANQEWAVATDTDLRTPTVIDVVKDTGEERTHSHAVGKE